MCPGAGPSGALQASCLHIFSRAAPQGILPAADVGGRCSLIYRVNLLILVLLMLVLSRYLCINRLIPRGDCNILKLPPKSCLTVPDHWSRYTPSHLCLSTLPFQTSEIGTNDGTVQRPLSSGAVLPSVPRRSTCYSGCISRTPNFRHT